MDDLADRAFWLAVRHALLILVDAIERRYGLARTAEARKLQRCAASADEL